ncbi:MAG: hypothetical protein R3D68_07200 [Hyphomicrobiaceae bacterium]
MTVLPSPSLLVPEAPLAAPNSAPWRFLTQLNLRHGPVNDIARFLLAAERHVRSLGIRLEFGTFEELLGTNRANSSTWRPLVPVLDHRHADLRSDNAFCILGRDATGRVVATQAARLLDMSTSTLKDEAESLRMFYGANPPDDFACLLSAPSASKITGKITYSGGVWYAKPFRGHGLSAILPRMCRLLALARWNSDFALSFVEDILIRKGLPARYGYPRSEPHFMITDHRLGDCVFFGGLIWISHQETLKDLSLQLTEPQPEINTVPKLRCA